MVRHLGVCGRVSSPGDTCLCLAVHVHPRRSHATPRVPCPAPLPLWTERVAGFWPYSLPCASACVGAHLHSVESRSQQHLGGTWAAPGHAPRVCVRSARTPAAINQCMHAQHPARWSASKGRLSAGLCASVCALACSSLFTCRPSQRAHAAFAPSPFCPGAPGPRPLVCIPPAPPGRG